MILTAEEKARLAELGRRIADTNFFWGKRWGNSKGGSSTKAKQKALEVYKDFIEMLNSAIDV